ncbi:UDP-glucose 4-epimerase family protein [Desulfohalovibrio reitneri]|uniref:UDP-glucose 4-epimerase family protein n=1 Tax=Desulfohalovibrio reitneri TaxID=1307759 RepID=UPI0004A70ED6|nr:SDR family oxidoreductase [Desulfohalovibrio reitneri]
MRVLVTGATGFVGRALVRRLLDEGHAVRAVVRAGDVSLPDAAERVVVPDLAAAPPGSEHFQGMDAVAHLAARVHRMRDSSEDPLAANRRLNRDATLALARRTAECGVSRFLFLSTVKVHGEATHGRPFRETDAPAPEDPYAISKLEAERALADIPGLAPVVLRPPLVYGPGVRANFLRLLKLARSGLPLPLGAARNKRSLVSVDNLADAALTCLVHPAAPGRTFLVSDGRDLSTADLVRILARHMGRPCRLLPIPPAILRFAARALGKSALADRLLNDLQLDPSRLQTTLDWTPLQTPEEAMQQTAEWFEEEAE